MKNHAKRKLTWLMRKAGMNEEEMGKWLENCWTRRPGAIFSAKSLLVMDSMRAHLPT